MEPLLKACCVSYSYHSPEGATPALFQVSFTVDPGEFLAIVHALALMKQKNINMPVYSDSRNALSWVKQKKCKTKLGRTPKTEELFQMIERAENWLKNNEEQGRLFE